jgi:hypothetical protein
VKWFEFWEKKIRIPTRGWARTASPERSDQRGCPDCRRPTSTLENEIKWSLAATAARDRAARRPPHVWTGSRSIRMARSDDRKMWRLEASVWNGFGEEKRSDFQQEVGPYGEPGSRH